MKSLIKAATFQKLALAAVLGALALPSGARAGATSGKAPAKVEVEEAPFVTGNVTVNYNTHFISYGQDVWAIGNSWGEALVNPSFELDFNLGKGWQFYVNTWADVNSLGDSNIGEHVQEVDVNVGFYYTMDKWKFQLGYGAWMYASQTESIIDGKVSYNDGVWNPFLMLHGRVNIGDNIGFDNGIVPQIGIAPSKTWGKLTASLPVTVSFDSDNFHGGEAGFAYVSAGPVASYALTKHTSLNLAVMYYYTNDSVIPGNPSDSFVTGTIGVTVAF